MKKVKLLFLLFAFLINNNLFSQCDSIALIGEFNAWIKDTVLLADASDSALCTLIISFNEEDDTDENGIIEMKFRTVGNWDTNWGDDSFPTGIGAQDGMNIPVPYGNYHVSFNCQSFEYVFSDYVGFESNDNPLIKIYPIPALKQLHISNASTIVTLEVYSLLGQKIQSLQNEEGENVIMMDISGLDPGIFFLKTYTREGLVLTKKFVKN